MREKFNFFIGKWRVFRDLGGLGYAQGIANFSLTTTDELDYSEKLEVHFNDTEIIAEATRKYKYKYLIDKICKCANDKYAGYEILYELNFNNSTNNRASASGSFVCGDDTYHANYSFPLSDSSCYILEYLVIGPTKAYRITTSYTRIEEPMELMGQSE